MCEADPDTLQSLLDKLCRAGWSDRSEALVLSRAIGDRKGLVYDIGLLAEVSAKAGESWRAGTLWGAAEAENDRMWAGRWLHGTVEPERVLAYADEEFERGRSLGRELSLEDAIALALESDAT